MNLQSPNEMNFKRFLESEEASRNLEMVYVKVCACELCFCCLMTNDFFDQIYIIVFKYLVSYAEN